MILAKRGRGKIYPLFRTYEKLPSKGSSQTYIDYWERRKVDCRKNIGSFFTYCTQAIFGGQVLRNGQSHYNEEGLFELPQVKANHFRPDIIIEKGTTKRICREVKASSVHGGYIMQTTHQFANYTRRLLESPYSDPQFDIWKYGDSTEKKKLGRTESGIRKGLMLHRNNERGLVKSLSDSARSLVILPHNLMALLCASAPNKFHNQMTSNSSRNSEVYYGILGTYITMLADNWQNPQEAFEQILEYSKKRTAPFDPLEPLKAEDFMLDSLIAERFESPKITLGGYRFEDEDKIRRVELKPIEMAGFPIIIYRMQEGALEKWKSYLHGNLNLFLEGLGLKEIWEGQERYIREMAERSSAHDDIPF